MGKKTKVGKTRKDKFYKLAKETGFRSRAAFKLIQLNRKFGFLQQSQVCIDLCAAPGGWMQVAKQNMPVSSIVIGVDLYPIRAIPGCIGLVEDITTDKCRTSLSRELKTWKADVVLNDGAPNVGKNWLFDAYQQICLTLQAVKLSTHFLKSNGWFVTKVFRSKDYNALVWVLKQLFRKVHATKPSASRKESAEIFVVCQGYLAPAKIDPKLLDAKYVFEELDLENQKKPSMLHPDKVKRIKAEGYTEKEISNRNDLSVTEFMESDNALASLQGIGSITIDHEGVKMHPRTTVEIIECCKDIKVLGRKDIKGIILWHKHVKADLFKKEDDKKNGEVTEEAPKKELTAEELEDLEMDELDQQIAELNEQEQREAKRKRKKTMKEKTKLSERMNLKMIIKGDEGPREEGEDGMFELHDIKTGEEMEKLQDVAPDFVAENLEIGGTFIPKFKKYEKDNEEHLDDDGLYDDPNGDISELSEDESDDLDQTGLGLSDEEATKTSNKKVKKIKKQEHPLIKSGDFRDKDTRRQQRVQLWYEKDNLQKMESDDDEDYDLNHLANEYKTKGVEVLGEDRNITEDLPRGKKSKRKARHAIMDPVSSSSESSDSDEYENKNDDEVGDKGLNGVGKAKKVRLTEEELALGAMMIKGRKTKRDLIDGAWNRYTFNDQNLPDWFVQDELLHMKKPVPVPPEIADEYHRKVNELNVRPIKKVMEAKARKKRRALKRLAKAKKKAEKIMENNDSTANEKVRQIKKLYKKAEDKKKELTYVVAKKHSTGKRARRPPGVKGRYRVVDPRMKKDKRSITSKEKKKKTITSKEKKNKKKGKK